MIYQVECVLGCGPVEASPATFALARHVSVVRIFLTYTRQNLTAFPLEAYALDVGGHSRIFEQPFHVVITVGVERAEIEVDFGMLVAQGGSEILHVKAQYAFGSPGTSGVGGIAVGFVLVHYHADVYVLLGIKIDEPAEHVGVALKVTRALNHVVLHCQTAGKQILVGIDLLIVGAVVVTVQQTVTSVS